MKKEMIKRIYLVAIVGEIVLALVFLILDFNDSHIEVANRLKFLFIVISFLIPLLLFKNNRLKLLYLLALFSILIADYYLLFKSEEPSLIIGVSFYILAHLFFNLILIPLKKNLLFYLFLLCFITSIFLIDNLEVSAIIYAFCLILNTTITGINYFKKLSVTNLLLFSGFFCLLLCDLSIALYQVYDPIWKLIWLFYVPFILLVNISMSKKIGDVQGEIT